MDKLRAILRQSGDRCEAQLLELDIAVASDSEEGLLREIEYTLTLDYQIARERGQTPFASVAHKTPRAYHDLCRQDVQAVERHLRLSDEVSDALAIALHTSGKPKVSIQRYAHAV